MAAADPPPPSSEGEPSIDRPGRTRGRRRVRIGRVLTDVPLPAAEIEGRQTPEIAPARPFIEVSPAPWPAVDGTLAAAVLALAAFLASFAAANPDLWTHLAAGRLVAHGQFPFGPDPFSAAAGAVWINHAWLFDLFAYLIYRPGGVALVAVKAGLVVALAALLLSIRRRRDSGGLGPAAAVVLVLLAASPMLVLRSAIASYLLFAALLVILHRGGQLAPGDSPRGKWKLPAAVGILFLLWVNLDAGFVFGLLLLVAWTAGAALQRPLPLGDEVDDPGEAPLSAGILAVCCLAAVVACSINPYHVRAFRLPPELAILTVPESIKAEPSIEATFRDQFLPAPFTKAYRDQIGWVAATAFYLLLAASLASFAVNAAGWRWRRVLTWTAFACLATTVARTVPYFAMIASTAAVLNYQAALARRRSAWTLEPNRRASHLRSILAGASRTGLILAIAILLVLAWPGWLGPDARSAAPARRVTWRIVPDATAERLATQLADWYKAGELREGESRGFHLQPEFSMYCAWFCPAEKGIFDSRLTAPPEVLADYLALRRSVAALGGRAGKDRPPPPDALLRKYGVTHLVLSGGEALNISPFFTGLGYVIFGDPVRFPTWAIQGRGVICGWGNSYPKLRMDPVRLAVGNAVEPLPPPPTADLPTTSLTLMERYRSSFPPPPAETAEAGLWLAYRQVALVHSLAAMQSSRLVGELLRRAPTGLPDLASPMFSTQPILESEWRRSPEGQAGRAANLLAIRAARRAIWANPEHPEAYVRLAQAYGTFDSDVNLGRLQTLAAARQGVTRLTAVAAFRRAAPREELVLQETLYNLYRELLIPGISNRAQPLDLMLEALTRLADLRPAVLGPSPGTDPESPAAKQFEQEQRRLQSAVESLAARVHKQTDDYWNRVRDATPKQQAVFACQYGLAREALKVLRDAKQHDLDVDSVLLMANLFLLAGEAENARDVLQSPALSTIEQFPIQNQFAIHSMAVDAAAALGDYATAVDQCQAELEMVENPAGVQVARAIADLVLPDASPANPLTRVGTLPAWAGLLPQGRLAVVNNIPFFGDLIPVYETVRQHTQWLARQGLMSLEAGNAAAARQRFSEAAKANVPSDDRALAQRWLELWTK